MFDLVIVNGRIVDGSGNPWYAADVAVKEGRIAAIGNMGRAAAHRVIDANGAIVAPGFIDIHTHTDMTIDLYPEAPSTVMQGVTTAVIGNCGLGLAPINSHTESLLRSYLAPFRVPSDWEMPWRTFAEYLQHLEQLRPSINLAPLVAHGTIRIAAMGFDNRVPTDEEMTAMREAVREALCAGAFGLSSGLIYVPGTYSTTEELVELARELRATNGVYVSHIRDEGDTLEQAVEEALTIGRKVGVRVQISHLKAKGRRNWGKVKNVLAMLEAARSAGLEVSCDVYPYTASSTTITSLLPAWLLEGGVSRMLRRLRSPDHRARALHELSSRWGTDEWSAVRLAACTNLHQHTGQSLTTVAEQWGISPAEALLKIVEVTEGACTIVNFAMAEEDMYAALRHPLSMVASDGWAFSPQANAYVHPRSYGTFPRALRIARENGLLTVEEMVRKMTAFPSQVLRLHDRGRLAVGMWADIVIFDEDHIEDRATFGNPHQFPQGILYVLVNGKVAVEEGEYTGLRAGRVLRYNRS